MKYAVYITAAVAIGLLIGFVMLSIGWLKKKVLRNIRSKTVGLISVYDDLLEQKSEELSKAESEAPAETEKTEEVSENADTVSSEELDKLASAMLGLANLNGAVAYRDKAVGDIYRLIRQNFSFRVEELLGVFREYNQAPAGIASTLLEQISYDTAYDLSTLPEEDQLNILSETLSGETRTLVEDYLGLHKKFNMLEFYEYLKGRAEEEPRAVCIRVPYGTISEPWSNGRLNIIPDAEICEGFQVEADRLMYDYSIKTREMG